MRLTGIVGAFILAATCAASCGQAARAADLGAFYAPNASYAEPQQPLEFGTGWYLRGDAAYSDEVHPRFDAALGTVDRNATSSGYSLGLGVGYKLNSWFRADLTADYLDPFKYGVSLGCGSTCAETAEARVMRWDGLANGYVDLGTWFGLTPYVGAGAGVSGTHATGNLTLTNTYSSATTTTALAGRNDYHFAWAAMAGVSYAVSPHLLLDVGYRYLDLGKTTVPLRPLPVVQQDLTAHQVRVGVRYMID